MESNKPTAVYSGLIPFIKKAVGRRFQNPEGCDDDADSSKWRVFVKALNSTFEDIILCFK